MKNIISLIACAIICIVLVQYRVANIHPGKPLKITEWDANGYYLYLPAIVIYKDYKQLKWLTPIDQKYKVTGGSGINGDGFQAQRADNGNYAFKYLGGVALMELPFFCIGHFIALHSHQYPPDGFSPPYQYALAYGILFYSLLAVLMLRKVLLVYFDNKVTAITLLLVCLATNYIQYAAVDSGQSHAYIFLLYTLLLFTVLKWHRKPTILCACLTGYICGLATISRPTEAIIIFIPIMWNTHTKAIAKEKWALVKQNKSHIAYAAIFGMIGILPQLIYWKSATGTFIYDVGSKWFFLNPWFRVLFGFEKGWFIYTPVTVLFIVGMFFMRSFPFKKSVLWFCLLNIYIIIAWSDWRYGGSYSTRALVQSYPVFALPLAALTNRVMQLKWKPVFLIVGAYLTGVNLFQINQYCHTILHYNDMNRLYYSRIYLNPHPTPLDMSFLDNDEALTHEDKYTHEVVAKMDSPFNIHVEPNNPYVLKQATYTNNAAPGKCWIKLECNLKSSDLWGRYMEADLLMGKAAKHGRVRLSNAISDTGSNNDYILWMSVPDSFKTSDVKVYINSPFNFDATINKLLVTKYYQK